MFRLQGNRDALRECARYNQSMPPRIAIPIPHAGDREYAERALPQYEKAVAMAGGEPVRIPLDQPSEEVMKLIERCDAVLLPGSKADVDPAKYDMPRAPQTADADSGRDTVDELLLQDAYNKRKPVLGICYGLQILNVYRTGTLIQHIESAVNHAAGRKVQIAHTIEVEPESKLEKIMSAGGDAMARRLLFPSIPAITRLRTLSEMVCALSPALRKTESSKRSKGPRRITSCSRCSGIRNDRSRRTNSSRAIFRALVDAARVRHEKHGHRSPRNAHNQV